VLGPKLVDPEERVAAVVRVVLVAPGGQVGVVVPVGQVGVVAPVGVVSRAVAAVVRAAEVEAPEAAVEAPEVAVEVWAVAVEAPGVAVEVRAVGQPGVRYPLVGVTLAESLLQAGWRVGVTTVPSSWAIVLPPRFPDQSSLADLARTFVRYRLVAATPAFFLGRNALTRGRAK